MMGGGLILEKLIVYSRKELTSVVVEHNDQKHRPHQSDVGSNPTSNITHH